MTMLSSIENWFSILQVFFLFDPKVLTLFEVLACKCFIAFSKVMQKQPSRGALRKRCFENIQQIYSRTPMPKSDFNKVALQSNFIEITLRHGCSSVNLLRIFRTPFTKNTPGRLLLAMTSGEYLLSFKLIS